MFVNAVCIHRFKSFHMYFTLVDNKLTCTFKMAKKLTVNEVTEQITADESVAEWFESDDDLVGSDNEGEGEVDSFHLWAGNDPDEDVGGEIHHRTTVW